MLTQRFMTIALFAAPLIFCGCNTTMRTGPTSIDSARAEAQAAQMVNDARTAAGLSRLSVDPRLSRAARAQSETMRSKASFAADATEGVGHWGNLRKRVEQMGYSPRVVRENVAGGEGVGIAELHQMLLDSPKHRVNVLCTDCAEMGVGVVFSNRRLYLTQVFGAQRQ